MNNLLPIAASCLLAGGAIGYVIGNTGDEKAASENVADQDKSRIPGSSRSVSRSGSSSADSNSQVSGKPSSYEEVANVPMTDRNTLGVTRRARSVDRVAMSILTCV